LIGDVLPNRKELLEMTEVFDGNEHGSTADFWAGYCAVVVAEQQALGREVHPRAAQLAAEAPVLGGFGVAGFGVEFTSAQY
jgi:hypothetical protein